MTLPSIGFGTSPYKPGAAPVDIEQSVRVALRAGYRMFDLAEAYGNEIAIGRALRDAGLPRAELRLIGKVWPTNFAPEHLRRACEASLERLGVERFDFYLLHSAEPRRHVAPLDDASRIGWDELLRRGTSEIAGDIPLEETWNAMQELVKAGLTDRIGVSNFTAKQIESLGESHPATNEIPCWPFDGAVVDWHARREILLLGYSPLRRDILDAEAVRAVAGDSGRTPAQVILRWLIQTGIRPLTSSCNSAHIRESLGALDFELSDREMSVLSRVGLS